MDCDLKHKFISKKTTSSIQAVNRANSLFYTVYLFHVKVKF